MQPGEGIPGKCIEVKRFESESFDLVLLFGPMYHLKGEGEKLQALLEAKRVLKPNGVLLVAYIMNEFSVLTYAFKDAISGRLCRKECWTETFHCTEKGNELYSMVGWRILQN